MFMLVYCLYNFIYFSRFTFEFKQITKHVHIINLVQHGQHRFYIQVRTSHNR